MAAKPDLLMADTSPSTAALQRETHTIPIVFVRVSDPVGQGFVADMARPGGNITGFINYEPAMSGKMGGPTQGGCAEHQTRCADL